MAICLTTDCWISRTTKSYISFAIWRFFEERATGDAARRNPSADALLEVNLFQRSADPLSWWETSGHLPISYTRGGTETGHCSNLSPLREKLLQNWAEYNREETGSTPQSGGTCIQERWPLKYCFTDN